MRRSSQEEMERLLEKISSRKISVRKAAEKCGISLWKMLDVVKEKRIDWVDYDDEDLKKDLSLLKYRSI